MRVKPCHNKALFLLFLWITFLPFEALQAKRKRKYQRIPTHPIFYWAKTISISQDQEQRRVAAFKLSQYSQPIYQDRVIETLLGCMKDPDLHIKVLCTKALGKARKKTRVPMVKKALINQFNTDPFVRNTVVRAFIQLKATDKNIHDRLLKAALKTKKPGELVVLMSYFEQFGSGSNAFVQKLVVLYARHKNTKVQTAIVKALAEKAKGQDVVIQLLSNCTRSESTPLVLTCLSGLQEQGKKDTRSWKAVENTIQSNDPDVLEATLDVIDALPETAQKNISTRLLSIIQHIDNSEIKEKSVLALGTCGDKRIEIVNELQNLIKNPAEEEDVRIAAALVLGKQATLFPAQPNRSLATCAKKGQSQSLRTACQLGWQELKARKSNRLAPTKKRSLSTKTN